MALGYFPAGECLHGRPCIWAILCCQSLRRRTCGRQLHHPAGGQQSASSAGRIGLCLARSMIEAAKQSFCTNTSTASGSAARYQNQEYRHAAEIISFDLFRLQHLQELARRHADSALPASYASKRWLCMQQDRYPGRVYQRCVGSGPAVCMRAADAASPKNGGSGWTDSKQELY